MINVNKNNIIITLFIGVYFLSNVTYQTFFPSDPIEFLIAKITPLILALFFILIKQKIIIKDDLTKLWYLSYFLFITSSFLFALFTFDILTAYKYLSINFFLTTPLLLFNFFINNNTKFELMIRVLSFCYLIFTLYVFYTFLTSVEIYHIKNIGIISKGTVSNLVILGLSILLLEKNFFYKTLILIITILIVYYSNSVKAFFILLLFLTLITFNYKKKYFLILVIFFPIILILFQNENFLYGVQNQPYYNLTINRVIVLFGGVSSDYAMQDIQGNIELRARSFELYLKNPIFGIGLENERNIFGTSAHSGVISLLIGTGIIGFILFFLFIFYILLKSFKYKYKDLQIIILMYLFWACVNPIYSNPNAILVAFIASSIFILRRTNYQNEA